ncbi:MAG: hypothetical protein AB7S75_19370 [Desulfococcaceae bacterium]
MKLRPKTIFLLIFLTAFLFPLANASVFFDVDGDGKTGLSEAIYALQVASGIGQKISDPILLSGTGSGSNSYVYELEYRTQGNLVFGDISMAITGKPLEKFQIQNGTLVDSTMSFKMVDAEGSIHHFSMILRENRLDGGVVKLVVVFF